MFVEPYGSSDVIEQNLEPQKIQNIHRKIAEKIIDDDIAQLCIRKFMWDYVGHPDKQRRLSGEQPSLHRTIDGIEMAYTRELFTGFSESGELVHVRAVSGMLTEPQGYVVLMGDIETGVKEPVVHKSSTVGGIDPRDIRLQLLDRAAMDNSPWGYCPNQYAPPYDQHMLYIRATNEGVPIVSYRKGREGEVAFYPIESLYESIDFIEEQRAIMARSAFTLITSESNVNHNH